MKSCAVWDCSDACEVLSGRWRPLVAGAEGGSITEYSESPAETVSLCGDAGCVGKGSELTRSQSETMFWSP